MSEAAVRPLETAAGETPAAPFSSVVPAIIGAALMMQTLSATVIANALPTMARSFHEDPIRLNTTITIYLLASAVFLPISGWMADRFGAKRIFLVAIVAYAASCAACGVAQNLGQMLLARAAEGAAGAMMGPVGRLVLLRSTPKHDLVRALSVLTMPALLGPVIGPPIGGFIITYGSWRWIFFLNLPIAAVGVALVWKFIADVREEDTARLDWIGLVLTGLGMAGVVYGFDNLGRGPMPPWAIAAMMGGGAALLALYVWHAARIADPILDLGLLKIRTFTASVVGGAFMRMGMGATPFMLALLLQVAFGLSALQAGLMTFASAAAALVMKTCAPPILARFGFKRTLSVNAVIVAVTFMAYALFEPGTPHWLIYAVLLTGGFFRSLQFTSLNGLAFADVDHREMSRASTMSTMAQQLSQSIGIGMAATFLHVSLLAHHAHRLTGPIIAPAFIAVGAVTLISMLFFAPLPPDAGGALHGPATGRRPRG
ncbi:MAG TPA: DHA2 family efflux MFS transporter permease subunit [Caulobacteraceae bacterium]|jgi:EmrB/QacA subfamily drug resistance transporter|nr:DHA2 family efflux MFS transporter permease subunit [Caulobacteraceae bacterium]